MDLYFSRAAWKGRMASSSNEPLATHDTVHDADEDVALALDSESLPRLGPGIRMRPGQGWG